MKRIVLVLVVLASVVGISVEYTYAIKGNQVTIDDDCSCEDKDRRNRVFDEFVGGDCTNTNNILPTIWIDFKEAPASPRLYTVITPLNSGFAFDSEFEYISCDNTLYYLDIDSKISPNFDGDGTYAVEVYDVNDNLIGKTRYVIDLVP